MPTNRIHNLTFLKMSRKPSRPGDEMEVEVRAGVNGVGIWVTGHRGAPFQIVTFEPVADINAACDLFTQYTILRGLPPVEVEFADHQEPNCLYKVLDVQPLDEQVRAQLKGIKAGVGTNFQGWIGCVWVLLPVNENVP